MSLAPFSASRLLRFARYAWASPCTLVGLLLVAPTFLFGARARVVHGVIEVANPLYEGPDENKQLLWPFRAITFGHVVVARGTHELDLLRSHEHAHVRQYERWGLFFFVAYPLASLWELVCGRRPYFDNRFEVDARDHAAKNRWI